MRIAAIGIGGAGGRVVDALWQDNEQRSTPYVSDACAIDTDRTALENLQHLPADHRHAFGLDETNGTGTSGDRTRGGVAIEAERRNVRRNIDPLITSDVDALVLIAGLAGGTGGGVLPHLADALAEIYEQPLYAVSLLPPEDDEQSATNTLRTLSATESTVETQLLFDTASWLGSAESIQDAAEAVNRSLVERLGALFAAGEATDAGTVGQSVVDASEIINTLEASTYATLGYASQDLDTTAETEDPSLLTRVSDLVGGTPANDIDDVTVRKAVETTLRKAVRGKLTAECTRESVDKGLVVFGGPPAWLHREAIADGRSWLATECQSAEIRSGDVPAPNRTTLSVLVLLSGLDEVPRLETLKEMAR
jgi:cell division GTPase FtsZ